MNKYLKVVIPRKVLEFLTLCLGILNKHTSDGVNSLLSSLGMTQMASRYTAANLAHNTGVQKNKDKELAFENRNIVLGINAGGSAYFPNTVLYYVVGIRDFLLGLYKGNERQLGLWFFEVNSKNNVVVPRSPIKLMTLARGIIDKHIADGVSSPLSVFDMTAFEALLTSAIQEHEGALNLEKEKELEFEKRNILLGFGKGKRTPQQGNLLNDVMSVRDVLLGLKKGSEQELGLWGFEVNASGPAPDPDPTPDPDPDPTPGATIIAGNVREMSTNNPIEGANITINTSQGAYVAISSPMGTFAITLPETIEEEETANIMVVKEGYLPYVQVVTIVPNVSIVFDFMLDANG